MKMKKKRGGREGKKRQERGCGKRGKITERNGEGEGEGERKEKFKENGINQWLSGMVEWNGL